MEKNGSKLIRRNNGNGLHIAKSILDEYKVAYKVITKKSSNIAQTIVEEYHTGDYQLISLASRRKSGFFDRLFLKRVSTYVVKNVDCPVLQVHPPRYGKKFREIGDIFIMLDGTERDAYLTRWAKTISSIGLKGHIYSYHVLELPSIFPLDEASKVPSIDNSRQIFENYAVDLGRRYGLKVTPSFLYGHSVVKAMHGETRKLEPDAIILGHTKDEGLRYRFRTALAYKVMRKIDSAVIVFHMPDYKM